MNIDGNKLLIYLDGEPIGVTTGATIDLSNQPEPPALCGARDYKFEGSGLWKFDSNDSRFEWTYKQRLQYEWYMARTLPRKKKKALRKRVSIAYAKELYREKVMDYLDGI